MSLISRLLKYLNPSPVLLMLFTLCLTPKHLIPGLHPEINGLRTNFLGLVSEEFVRKSLKLPANWKQCYSFMFVIGVLEVILFFPVYIILLLKMLSIVFSPNNTHWYQLSSGEMEFIHFAHIFTYFWDYLFLVFKLF